MLVGEVFLLDTGRVATYYGRGDELQLCFNFPPLFVGWDAARWRACIDATRAALDPRAAWPTWVLSNHDLPRHASRYGGGEARLRAAAVLLLGLRGSPFLYMGEELGLADAQVPPAARVDPGGRDGCRAPIPWERGAGHGWPARPWLPFAPEADTRCVESQREQADSTLHFYRHLLALRRASPALRRGSFEWLDAPDGVLAWRRREGSDDRCVAVSFVAEPRRLALPGSHRVEACGQRAREGQRFDGSLAPDEALLLRPEGG
jgi:alpha-glucosidase